MKTEMIIRYESLDGVDIQFKGTDQFNQDLAVIMGVGGFWTEGDRFFIPWHQVISVEKRERDAKP